MATDLKHGYKEARTKKTPSTWSCSNNIDRSNFVGMDVSTRARTLPRHADLRQAMVGARVRAQPPVTRAMT
jgi:hypothetical protein